jgi:hypothetical protein
MRVILALIFSSILSTSTFADSNRAPMFTGEQANVIENTEPDVQSVAFIGKKKKIKSSNKGKKRNRSMGKKLKRKNDDTLRR